MDRSSEIVQLYAELLAVPADYGPHDQRQLGLFPGMGVEFREIEFSPLQPDPTAERLRRYDAIIGVSRGIFEDRNRKYGDAISYTGVLGAVVQIVGDYNRVRNLVVGKGDHGRSHRTEVEDKLRDILNYCVIALMMLEEDNFEGRA